jgi:hypothetical protein
MGQSSQEQNELRDAKHRLVRAGTDPLWWKAGDLKLGDDEFFIRAKLNSTLTFSFVWLYYQIPKEIIYGSTTQTSS